MTNLHGVGFLSTVAKHESAPNAPTSAPLKTLVSCGLQLKGAVGAPKKVCCLYIYIIVIDTTFYFI